MAAGPYSIDPTTYLDELLAQASPDLMRDMLQGFINQILSTQADQVCGADYATVSDARVNVRNGYRHRDFDTRVGTVDVAVPKLRTGSFFPDWLLERRTRAERALTTVIATCYLKGVSTRRMNDLVASLGINNLSKSQVSEMAKDLDVMVEDFRTRPLDTGPYLNDLSRWTIDGAFSWDETTKYHGTRSAKFTPGATGNHGGSLLVKNPYLPTLAPRDGMFGIYRLSARIKTAGASIPGTPNGIRFNMSSIYRRITGETPVAGLGGGATSWLLPTTGNVIPAMEWTRIQALTCIGPASNTAQPSVYVQNIAGGSNPIWVDEVKMELVGYTPEITLRGTLTGTTNSAVDTQIHDLSRHRYTVIPDATPKGIITATVSDGHRLFVKSTDATDTMGFTVTIKPGSKYHAMELTSEGA